jgi:hypothetical protein
MLKITASALPYQVKRRATIIFTHKKSTALYAAAILASLVAVVIVPAALAVTTATGATVAGYTYCSWGSHIFAACLLWFGCSNTASLEPLP